MSYLGLDIGISCSKAVVFDIKGNEIASASRNYSLIREQQDWAELDSVLVADYCFELIREVASKTKSDPIKALAISCQGEAFTAIDKNGKALCHAMVSSDARAKDIARGWSEKFGKHKLYEITGHTAHPLFTLFKLIWIRDNRPNVWVAATRFLCFEDYLIFKLGVEPVINFSLAGRTMLFDIKEECWSREILNEIGLDENKLAKPMPSGSIAGKIPGPIASSLGLGNDVLLVTGGHDQCCGALGAGINKAGQAMYALGTVECVAPVFDKPVFSEDLFRNNLCTYHHTIHGKYVSLGYSLTGGNMFQWCRDELAIAEKQLAKEKRVDVYDLILDGLPDKPTDLLALPYFTPSGTPYFDTDLGGAILGLRLSSTREEIIKTLLEGVIFEIRLNLDIMERSGMLINHLHLIGGGTRNRKLVQLKADVLGRPISVMKVSEAGCLGAAMLACVAHKKEALEHLMERWIKIALVIEPDSRWTQTYSEKFSTYKNLYPALKTIQ